MTVSAQTTYNLYTGNGVTTVFPYQFKILAAADLQVYVAGVLKTLNVDYSVSGVGADVGGSVTFLLSAPAAAAAVSIMRVMTVKRTTDYQQLGDFLTPVVNPDFDNAILLIQDVQTQLGRSIRLPADEVGTLPTLPAKASRIGFFLTFDASGNVVVSAGTGADAGLRTDLASQVLASDGVRLLGRRRTETGAVGRALNQLLDQLMAAEDFGANTVPGTTSMSVAIQAAINAATNANARIALRNDMGLSVPLLVKSGTQQNVSLVGDGRVSTILRPLAADIKAAPQNINCLLFNQKDNGHIHLERIRWIDAAANTGVFMYAKEGGGGDASGQASFSMDVTDCWFSPSTNNAGGFQGGYSNLSITRSVFESMKNGCWLLEGVGNSDHHHSGIVLNACYDSYLYAAADTNTKALIRVNGLHAYQHFRGPLFEIKNGIGIQISDVALEANAAQVGNVALFKFTDCKDLNIGKCTMTIANGTPRGACGFESINGNTGHIRGLIVNADVGIRVSGAGVLDLVFEDCDFTGCQYAFQHLSGNASGKIKFVNCRLNNCEYGMLMSAGAPTYTIDFIGGEIMNAGYDGTAPGVPTGRNVNLSAAGPTIRFIGTKIGHDDVKATATHRFNLTGTGTVLMQDPYLVGTPPTAFSQGAQALTLDGVDSTMPGMTQFVPSLGGTTTYTAQSGSWSLKGGRVHFSGQITVNVLGTGSASVISGLPFTVGAGTPGVGVVPQFSGLNATVTSLGLLASGTSLTLKGMTAAAAVTSTVAGFANGTDVRFSGSYTL